jgi:hypothetical protein
MFIQPHPLVMTTIARHRRDELLSQADAYRLGRLARTDAKPRLRRVDLAGIAGNVLALALPFIA